MTEPYIHTVSGRRIYVRHPDLNKELHLSDFAHSLARIARYNGHADHVYSVASHSLMVADLAPLELAASCLMHDAIEAVLGDVTSPLKSLLLEYRALQETWTDAMERRWGVPLRGPEIKIADRMAYAIERRDLMTASFDDEPWPSAGYAITPPRGAPHCAAYAGKPRMIARWWHNRATVLGIPEVA